MVKISTNKILLIFLSFMNISCLSRALYQGKERCFYDNYYNNMNIIITYNILDKDVKLTKGKKNLFRIYIQSLKYYDKYYAFFGTKLSGKFSHNIEVSDKYKVCIISNDKEIFENKKFLYLQFQIQYNLERGEENTVVQKDFQVVDDTMNQLNSKVDNIENMQNYQMTVEDSFSDKQINSASRLAWLSLCQIAVICVVGVYHVIYLRRIFKDKIWTPF